ncbi:uncharacterized protein LOC113373949 [Ctenocephalides felis]|uniref:uncharacterized protein LOC113373949 n=1 Tax=Ctenocephalides felis TaxID=7515 RepID=UPI000E6E53DD|nr:uncharacterized protein LOC113373949 [Ctenocephalides felis]
MAKNNYVVALFSDIKGAYDNVLPEVLEDTLANTGLPGKFINSITTNIRERKIFFRINGKLIGPRKIYKGLPQGESLSPILYLIYVRDIEKIWETGTKILQFADDVVIYIEKSSLQEAYEVMSRNIDFFHEWLAKKGLELSDEKSSIGIFTRRRKLEERTALTTKYHTIKIQENNKFLGVTFDKKLSFKAHINQVITKIEPKINILRMVNRTWWGAHPTTALNLYRTIIRPSWEYGSLAFSNSSHCRKLEKIQYKCLRLCIGAMISTPTNALLVECGEMPLHLRFQYLSDKFVLKKYQVQNNRTIENIKNVAIDTLTSDYWRNRPKPSLVYSYIKVIETRGDTNKYNKHPYYNFFTLDNSYTIEKIFNTNTINIEDYKVIFTDGSKINNKTGCALFYENDNIKIGYKLPDFVSIWSAELIAIKKSIEYIESHKITKAVIVTDSKSCIDKLKNLFLTNRLSETLVYEVWNRLIQLLENGYTVKLLWTRSHSGSSGNDEADSIAKWATEYGTMINLATRKDYINNSKKKILEKWQEQWNRSSETKGRHYKAVNPKLKMKPWFRKYADENRGTIVTITRLRLNHGNFPAHLKRLGIIESESCPCGASSGTSEHIILECSIFEASRAKWLEELHSIKTLIKPFNLTSLLQNLNCYPNIIRFVNNSKIKL